jgi:hypothetical protein
MLIEPLLINDGSGKALRLDGPAKTPLSGGRRFLAGPEQQTWARSYYYA